jgi:hypothetical protein
MIIEVDGKELAALNRFCRTRNCLLFCVNGYARQLQTLKLERQELASKDGTAEVKQRG